MTAYLIASAVLWFFLGSIWSTESAINVVMKLVFITMSVLAIHHVL